jgi:hypothetical protein
MAKVTYTTATLSAELDTTPKELRKFLRSDLSGIEKVGKGGRYSLDFTATQLKALTRKHNEWVAATIAKREAAKIEKAAEVEATGAVTENDIAELDEEFEISDPTEADLELIDDTEDLDLTDLEA